eukprot:gb/GECG01012049.1/.p1 GENE.gb/GECG01012049.1/~~gb/GECG01012049.1/.p1  ORF type:complete len:1787 (+),score=203.96 gb/GECG01012049.1/:1-5361(+)
MEMKAKGQSSVGQPDEAREQLLQKSLRADSTPPASSKTVFWIQLKTLVWKNLILFQRKKRDKFREFVIPLIFLAVLVSIGKSLKNKNYDSKVNYRPESVNSLNRTLDSRKLAFAPCGGSASGDHCRDLPLDSMQSYAGEDARSQDVLTLSGKIYANQRGVRLLCCDSEDNAIKKLQDDPKLLAGIVAFDYTNGLRDPSGRIKYRIRIDTDRDLDVDTTTKFSSDYHQPPNANLDSYKELFLPIQFAVNKAILQQTGAMEGFSWDKLNIVQFPSYSYVVNDAANQLKAILPIYMVIIFSLQIRILLGRILEEKENKITESMKISGMSTAAMWLSWMISYGTFNTIIVLLIVLVTWVGDLLASSNSFLVFLFYFIFMWSCMLFSILVSSFFSKSKTGGAVGMLGFLVLSTPSYAFTGGAGNPALLGVSCLLPPTAFSLGNAILTEAEKVQRSGEHASGIQFSNFFDRDITNIDISFGVVFLILILDLFILGALAWYCDKVIPTEFGAKRHPLFCLKPRYWRKPKPEETIEESRLLARNKDESDTIEAPDPSIEPVSSDIRELDGVHVAGLTKEFRAPEQETQGKDEENDEGRKHKKGIMTAVDNLSLNFYQDHITCLLGHNGAGKTTTVAMLTGLCTPSTGDGFVFGRSITKDIDGARRIIGNCPQHDTLFEELTPFEHMRLYAGLKGYDESHSRSQILALFAFLGISEKIDESTASLSGGQKRKLSIAMALIGNPKVLFLDEPTSGMDPDSRRAVWSLLEKAKKNRAIILTTHFMDEADILGDRIAILSKGKLRVCGSSLFLKSRFGLGYRLDISASVDIKSRSSDSQREIDELVDRGAQSILELVRESVPLAKIQEKNVFGFNEQDRNNQLYTMSILLPLEDSGRFAKLFSALEEANSGIHDFGISITSLEEVFLKIAEVEARGDHERMDEVVQEELNQIQGSGKDTKDSSSPVSSFVKPLPPITESSSQEDRVSPTASFMEQLKAQLWRRLRSMKRDKRGIYLQTVLPLLFIGLSFVFQSLNSISTTHPRSKVSYDVSQLEGNPNGLLFFSNLSEAHNNNLDSCLSQGFEDEWNWGTAGEPLDLAPVEGSGFARSIFVKGNGVAGIQLVRQAKKSSLNVNLFYNTSFTNALPTTLALFSENLLNWNCSSSDSASNITLQTYLDPLPKTSLDESADWGTFLSNSLMGFYITFGMCTIPALQAVNVVRERTSGAKNLQRIAGMKTSTFWIATWVFDSLMYLVPWVGGTIIISIVGFNRSSFPSHTIGTLSVLLLLYGLSVPWLAYALSFKSKDAVSAQTFTLLFFYAMSILLFFPVFALSSPSVGSTAHTAAKYMKYIFYVFPNFALAEGYSNVIIQTMTACAGLPAESCSPPSPWEFHLGGAAIVYLIASTMLWIAILRFLESEVSCFGGAKQPLENSQQFSDQPFLAGATEPYKRENEELMDEDALAEKQRVENEADVGKKNDSGVRSIKLRKTFGTPWVDADLGTIAVRDLSFEANQSEVFALLGVNGAGKTTTLNMLTGTTRPTSGSATLVGYDIQDEKTYALSTIGYCPQTDGLFPLMTGEEVLYFYAWLRGCTRKQRDALVNDALQELDLVKYRSVLTSKYSGGNKRKLSLAISYIAAPRVIFLDEPSTGMDPVSRRRMWELVRHGRQGRTTIITTHWMEEADALCDRIGIMVNGQFACLGTSQHLKGKYGQGYRVEVKAESSEDIEELLSLFQKAFPEVTLEEQHENYAVFGIGMKQLSLSQVFKILTENSERLRIYDYAVTQTTLEQVFLNIAKLQKNQ